MTPERIAELRAIIAAASLMDEEVNMGIGKAVTQKEFYQSAKLAFPQALDTIEAQQRRIEELEAALKPLFSNSALTMLRRFSGTFGEDEEHAERVLGAAILLAIEKDAKARAALQPKEPS